LRFSFFQIPEQVFQNSQIWLTGLSSYNEAKIEGLQLVSELKEHLHELMGMEEKATAMVFLRHYWHGLLYRHWENYHTSMESLRVVKAAWSICRD